MKNSTTGLVFTKSSCIGCNSCVLGCPVPEANIAEKALYGNFLRVDPDKCIHCGHCITACPHSARDYTDDSDEFLSALSKGEKISLVVAPSFMLRYSEKAGKILNYLKKRGLVNIYDGGFGGTITTWAIMNFLDLHRDGGFAISECPVFVNYVEKHSLEGVQHLIPVQSSVMCMGIYIKKHFRDTSKLAFLGNCPARKDEFENASSEEIYSYNLTVKKLLSRIDPSEYEKMPEEITLDCCFPSNFLYASGDAKVGVSNFLEPEKLILSIPGARKYYKYVSSFCEKLINDEDGPFLIDAMNCEHGCVLGPADDNNLIESVRLWERSAKLLAESQTETSRMLKTKAAVRDESEIKEMRAALDRFLSYLDPDDFRRDFADRFHQQYQVPEEILNEVFEFMHKYAPETRTTNCHACGYGSCREMARAIALGFNRRENCAYYEKFENVRLYMTDMFTGIPNLNSFNDRITEVIRRHETEKYEVACFSMIDNDLMYSRYGYDEVDKCIKEYAQIAASMVEKGELLARYGDVEFLALVEKSRMDDFLLKLNGITVHPFLGQRENDFLVNICAGVYQISDEDSVGDVIGKVGIAHRAAKDRNSPCRIYYDESMKDGSVEAAYLTKAFSDAIKSREFVVFYQPKVDLRSMKLHGAEALVRWNHAGEFIAPGRFIPLFEKNGYVVHVDFYVLDQVCRDLRSWLNAGLEPVRVSSNFSKLHIASPEIVNQIVDVIDKYGIPHELIEIEFTETTAAGETERLTQILRELHANGISTSIDDFGSGYSSLNMLQTMDFNVLKIDKGFLDAGIKDAKTKKIIGSIIRMARDLGMQVVAEGVEKHEELIFLKDNGCDMIQGYYFDKPLPGDEYLKRLKEPVYTLHTPEK
ncbi:MAG: EAL domain-containing protein [Lachnospiraceae bacterium]|nr:EAL domain-containing protein [Lachnospiraceae bacterium]